jgi:hypothetical protein
MTPAQITPSISALYVHRHADVVARVRSYRPDLGERGIVLLVEDSDRRHWESIPTFWERWLHATISGRPRSRIRRRRRAPDG